MHGYLNFNRVTSNDIENRVENHFIIRRFFNGIARMKKQYGFEYSILLCSSFEEKKMNMKMTSLNRICKLKGITESLPV